MMLSLSPAAAAQPRFQPQAASGGGGGGGKRSRKSTCPRRILQTAADASVDDIQEDTDDQQQQRRQQRDSAAPPQAFDAAEVATTATASTAATPAASNLTDCSGEEEAGGSGSEKRRRRGLTPPPEPQQPLPLRLKTPTLLVADNGGRPNLLRSLVTLSPQDIIPSLYTALSSGGFGAAFGSNFGALHPAITTAVAEDLRRPRGRPKGPAQPHAPVVGDGAGVGGGGGGGGQPAQSRRRAEAGSARAGPRPFDPRAAPLQPVRIITRKGVAYNRRPRSFYSAEIKLSVIDYAEQHGASAAERQFNIPLSTVQSWMRHENKARILRAPSDHQQQLPAAETGPALGSAPTPAPVHSAYAAAAIRLAPPSADEQPLNLTAPAHCRIPLPSNRH